MANSSSPLTPLGNSSLGFSKAILVSSVGVLFIALTTLYFLVVRIPDTDYQKAIDLVKIMQDSNLAATNTLSAIHSPSDIDTAAVNSLKKATTNYTDALAQLDKNHSITTDSAVRSSYAATKQALTEYGSSVETFTDSAGLYITILDTCNKAIQGAQPILTTDFDNNLGKCLREIDNGQSSKDETFNTSFFDDYRQNAKNLALALQQIATSKDNTTLSNTVATAINQSIIIKSRDVSYTQSNVSTQLDSLSKTIAAQQAKILR